MSNQIKLTIDVSDELLDKLLTVMALSSATPQMGGMPMQLMALAGGKPEPSTEEKKEPMGFKFEEADHAKKKDKEEAKQSSKGA